MLIKKWHIIGTIAKDKDHDKYTIKIVGRLTDINRRYLLVEKAMPRNYKVARNPFELAESF